MHSVVDEVLLYLSDLSLSFTMLFNCESYKGIIIQELPHVYSVLSKIIIR